MKNFSSLVKFILYSDIKIGNTKNIRKKTIAALILSFFVYLSIGIIYSLYIYSALIIFNKEKFDYINSNYLNNVFAVTSLLSIFLIGILVYNYGIYNKTENLLVFPLSGNKLFFSKILVGIVSVASFTLFPVIMNSFVLAGLSQASNIKLQIYSYISSTIFSISSLVAIFALISFILIFIESKTHFSTNKIFSSAFMLILTILAGLIFIYFIYISSYSDLIKVNSSTIASKLDKYKFLAPMGYLNKETIFLTQPFSYAIMPLSVVLDVALIFLLNLYTKKSYTKTLTYRNKELKLFKSKKNKDNLDVDIKSAVKEKKNISKVELIRELKLFFPSFLFSLITSGLSLISLVLIIVFSTSSFITSLDPGILYLIEGYFSISGIYFPQITFNSYNLEGNNIFMLMSFPTRKLNIFVNKFLSLIILYLPVSIINPILVCALFKLSYQYYLTYLFLAVSFLFASTALNYFLGLIKPNFNITKNDLMSQRPMFILAEILSMLLAAIYLILSIAMLFNPLMYYLIPLTSSFIYIGLGFLFLYYAKTHYDELMKGKKQL